MDHNLDDSLNLESAMGVDFDHSEDTVVNQADITLESTDHEEGITMEFEHIEEQPMLMDTGSEEIIDFMGEQFTLQEYSVQDHQMAGSSFESQEHNVYTSHSDTMIDLQFAPQSYSVPASGLITHEVQLQPKVFTLKSSVTTGRPLAKNMLVTKATAPRQIAIAPKPPKLMPANIPKKATFVPGKQFAIAPKPGPRPVAMVANRNLGLVKKVSLASAVQANAKGNPVLAQIGKQLVMVPAGGGGAQKIKLVSTGPGMPTVRLVSSADSEQAQLIANHNVGGTQTSKPVMTKVFVQGQSGMDPSNQPAVITKLLPSSTAATTTRYVTMQQKTVPISIANNKMVFTSPTKQSLKLAANKKQQIIAIKSPTPKLMPASAPQVTTTNKKVVITSNSAKNVILKTTAPTKTGNLTNVANAGQRTQLHQINVPGKGIQYIRLVTNPTQAAAKPSPKTAPTTMPSKTFVLTDSKGNLIQMTAEKMVSGQPPPLVVTGNMSPINRLTSKPQQKLVRIAPITSKSGQAAMQHARSGQSLLAPLPPAAHAQPAALADAGERLANRAEPDEPLVTSGDQEDTAEESADEESPQHIKEEKDSKTSLQALIADTVGEDPQGHMAEVEIDFERQQSSPNDSTSSTEAGERLAARSRVSPPSPTPGHLIVVPFCKQDMIVPDDVSTHKNESRRRSTMLNVEVDGYNTYESPTSPPELSESDMVTSDLALRPRKACNCTKSQCLKLYCDCFANGEFCNGCNCNNCHNNLENEELRQKAIRGCLERNPNAFRPKIGKSKTGGPEIIRRHNKGCNCKRSGCLKNYCECYEAKIACTAMCKCVGCRNVEETLERARRRGGGGGTARYREPARDAPLRPPPLGTLKQPCSFMTAEVIEAVCQCLVAAAVEGGEETEDERPGGGGGGADPVRDVIEEFARCLQDVISAAHQPAPPLHLLLDETHA